MYLPLTRASQLEPPKSNPERLTSNLSPLTLSFPIIYRPLCGGCAVRGADMRAKARGGSRRGDVPYGGRYARRARGNGLYGDLAGEERRGVWQGGYARYRAPRGRGADIKKNTLPRDIGILLF